MCCSQNFTLRNIKCDVCGSSNLIKFLNGQIVCADCGFVITQAKSAYNNGSNKGKRGPRQHKPLSTRKENKALLKTPFLDIAGVEELFKELRVSDSTERNIALILHNITRIVFALSLSEKVLLEATHIYRELAKKCSFKGKPIRALSSAIVYIASKKAGQPCGLHEIAHAANVPSKKVFKCCKFVLSHLNETAITVNTQAYVHRICMFLGLKDRTIEIVDKIMKKVCPSGYKNGKSLASLVSATIYVASKLTGDIITQRQIGEKTRVTEATIRARYKEIVKRLIFVVSI